jgi:hypothetical protein
MLQFAPISSQIQIGELCWLIYVGLFWLQEVHPMSFVQLLRWDGWQTVFWISLCTQGASMLSRISVPLSPWYG